MIPLIINNCNSTKFQNHSRALELYDSAKRFNAVSASEWEKKIKLLEKSVTYDAAFVSSSVELGNAYLKLAGLKGGKSGFYELSRKHLLNAQILNDSLPEVLLGLGSYYVKTGQFEKSLESLQKGLELYPEDPAFYSRMGYLFRYAGLLELSIDYYTQCLQLSGTPKEKLSAQSQITKSLIYQGRYNEALESHFRMLAYLDSTEQQPDEKMLFYEGMIHLYDNRIDKAKLLFDSAFLYDNESIWSLFGQAYKHAVNGETSKTIELLNHFEARQIVDGERAYRLVHFNALIGLEQAALKSLTDAIDKGFFCYYYMVTDPLLRNVTRTKEFELTVEKARRQQINLMDLVTLDNSSSLIDLSRKSKKTNF